MLIGPNRSNAKSRRCLEVDTIFFE